MCCPPLDALLEKLTITFTEVVRAPGVVLAPSSASVRPQILKQGLTTSGVMASHDSLHHVDTTPRPGGFSLPGVGSAIAIAV